ncbi:hypothetical protein Ddye_022017 [Dipteronia dyeriana]|uniref:KIB1-4 beta-propeller domain-containing protein n=1 Tax=Dipteronia dyeriana TaxID=168575 RepID=A0AAD9U2U8_9ROSI|nr:hypothetical protein Ddye_022017 [Dipteronia dyeriana]
MNGLIFNRELRVITSANPLDPNCIFVSIGGDSFGRPPAFCKLGDKSWKVISNLQGLTSNDVVFHKGELYAVDSYSNLLRVNLNSSSIHCLALVSNKYENINNYLVEFKGHLLLVRRREKIKYEITVGFDVFRLIQEEMRWNHVKDIGNNVILLGEYSSISIPAPRSKAKCICQDFKANCIYFIDDVKYWSSDHTHNDAGVYNMANHRIDLLPESWPIWTSPVNWLRPMF